jgi:hypothetical protein
MLPILVTGLAQSLWADIIDFVSDHQFAKDGNDGVSRDRTASMDLQHETY